MADQDVPIACTLAPGDLGGRVAWWRSVAAHALGDVEEIPGGARVRLPAVLEVEVRRLVAAESACCAFFSFEVDCAVARGEIVLSVSAPPEARPLVDALLNGADRLR